MTGMDTMPSRRALVASAVALLTLGTSGCLRPLYGPAAQGGDVRQILSTIKVTVDGDRLAHYVKNELDFELTGGQPAGDNARFNLVVIPKERLAGYLVDRAGFADSSTLIMEATYTLTEIGKPAPVMTGNAASSASYDRSGQRFANIRAARDAQIRNAKQIAEQIRREIAIKLATGT
jgi:LPS-assembly lipoprotein